MEREDKRKKLDLWSSVFWLALSVLVCLRSLKYGLGSFNDFGPGFLFFWCGIFLGSLSIIQVTVALRPGIREQYPVQDFEGVFENVNWVKIVGMLASLVGYAFLLEKVGFLTSTFLFVGFLLASIEAKKWYVVILAAFATTALTYILFVLLLKTRLPRGILGL